MTENNTQGPWGPSGNKPQDSQKPEDSRRPWSSKDSGPDKQPSPLSPPPDVEELLRKIRDRLGPIKPNGYATYALWGVLALFVLWILSGFYMVDANQTGVVMRFGAFNRTEMPGLRYHLPAPIEEVLLPVVTSQNEIQIGFRRMGRGSDEMKPFPQESLMLTQDENIINVAYTVFWRVNDVNKYLFEIRAPQTTIKMAAESVMREVIGQSKLQFALTEGRGQIAEEARTRLQALMDDYQAGIIVSQINLQEISVPDEVKDAFQDVVNARLDMERFQNQAAAHVNKVIPDAKGQAAKSIQEAMAYRDQKIAIAKGEAGRFNEVLMAYQSARDVTSKRLYLEMMESVLSRAQKVITDKGGATVPLYPLQDILKQKKQDAASSPDEGKGKDAP